jgi:Insertion element 4 transposase N-terminal/Transposase DDE domain
MLGIGKEVARIAEQQPTAERLKALKRIIPCATIKSILKQTRQARSCKRLPKLFMVWFVVGMGLFATDCYRQIFRWLDRFRPNWVPLRSSLCEARQRLGVAPLFWLASRLIRLLAVAATPGAFYRGLRLMAVDGFVVDVFDGEDNARVFGRPKGGRSAGAFPQARVLALCEVGTHILWKYLIKPIRCAEIVMVKTVLRYLDPTMLLLWDRGFLSYDNVRDVLARKANLLARIKKNLVFSKIKVFADGSFLAKLYPSTHDRNKDRNGLVVRIIEYTIGDPHRAKAKEVHRLLTTLLDAPKHPAKDLIELYHERWEEELAIDEVKTHQQERPVLRSQTPAGVVQEIHGMLLAHFVVRTLMFEAAATKNVPPRRVSFVGALKILRCRLPECPRHAPGQRRWYDDLVQEIAEEILPQRRDRLNPRVIKRKMSKWAKKRPHHYHNPQPTMTFRESLNIKC